MKPVLRYDFQMYSADSVAADANDGKGITSQGHARANKVVAFFRDPTTTDAVTSAPPIVRLFLEEAGFELSDTEITKVEGGETPCDKVLRRALAAQLTAALSNRALKKALARAAQETEFDVAAFIAAVVSKNEPQAQPEGATPQCKITPRSPSQLRKASCRHRERPR
ncbi:hypothetical protein AL073_06960 [Loktanella sp. 1ANDIMAR09]|nr:hypothetical protein AL073_06960 [Loktanella sp. 1ANDIMAR09]